MLTGRKAFEGKSQAGLLGAILKDDPAPVTVLQPMTPPASPEASVLAEIAGDSSAGISPPFDCMISAVPPKPPSRRRSRRLCTYRASAGAR